MGSDTGDHAVERLAFENLKGISGLTHAVFTRHGGTSRAPFDSLNVGLSCGDDPDSVNANRKTVARKLGVETLFFLNQVHRDSILIIRKEDAASFIPGKDVHVADGVITDMKGLGLVIQVADCQAVMLYEPGKKVIANLHSGWRGSLLNIIGTCVEKMVSEFGCDPAQIRAGISPSLGPCCAEFVNYRDEIPDSLWGYKQGDSVEFDFWRLSRDQLMEKGIKKDHIETMGFCTRCRTDLFFSYRGEKNTGRFACAIAMV